VDRENAPVTISPAEKNVEPHVTSAAPAKKKTAGVDTEERGRLSKDQNADKKKEKKKKAFAS